MKLISGMQAKPALASALFYAELSGNAAQLIHMPLWPSNCAKICLCSS